MLSSNNWICHRCLRSLRPASKRLARFQSTNAASPGSLTPAILSRARSIVSEHATLSAELNKNYDNAVARKAGELSRTVSALKQYEKAQENIVELRNLLSDPSTDAELKSLASDDLSTSQADLSSAAQSLRASLVPPHPFAALPCLLEIRPGAGGSEAALFAGDLFRMYVSYCQKANLHYSIIKYDDVDGPSDPSGSSAPLQEAIIEIQSAGAYGRLRCEAGVHRVQRVPATETKGRTHTSAASVLVLPSFPDTGAADGIIDVEDPESDYYIDPTDVRVDVMRAKGAGGQHVNTTESAVRLTHLPTSTVVAIQDSRSQAANKAKAYLLLRARVAQMRRETREEEMVKLRRSVIGVARVGRGDKVRTYNWQQQRITDHRSGVEVRGIDGVLGGGGALEELMESVRDWLLAREVEEVVALEQEQKKP